MDPSLTLTNQLTNVRIFSRCAASGKERGNCFGIRLRNAGSMSRILFVAPKINILSEPERRPSHKLQRHQIPSSQPKIMKTTHVMNSAFIIAVTSWSPLLRSRRNESTSSMKMILGCVFRARLNNPATNLFDSPNHLFVNTDAAMLMKVAPDSFARALASIVLPQPGGP